jgi:hypothetical protein
MVGVVPNLKPGASGAVGSALSKLKPSELGLLPRTTENGRNYLKSPVFTGGKIQVGWTSVKAFTDFVAGSGGQVFTAPGWRIEDGVLGWFGFLGQLAIVLPHRAADLVSELRTRGGAVYAASQTLDGTNLTGLVMPLTSYSGIPYAVLFSNPGAGDSNWRTKNYFPST